MSRDTPKNNAGCSKHARALLFFVLEGENFVWHYIGVEYGKKGGRTLLRRVSRGREMCGEMNFFRVFPPKCKIFLFLRFSLYSHTLKRGMIFGEGRHTQVLSVTVVCV
jgi:hypothetical protein